jgi:hypothetical protein
LDDRKEPRPNGLVGLKTIESVKEADYRILRDVEGVIRVADDLKRQEIGPAADAPGQFFARVLVAGPSLDDQVSIAVTFGGEPG